MKKIIIILLFQFFIFSSSYSTANNNSVKPIDEVAGGLGKQHRKPPKYAVLPTGKTLPQGIFRVEFPTAYTFDGSNGYGSAGKHVNNGFLIDRWMMGAVLQYGLSNAVTIAIGVPFVLFNQMHLNGNTFAQNSPFYSKYFNEAVNKSAAFLASTNNCNGATTQAECANQIVNNNFALPTSSTIVLPTGELYTIDPYVPVNTQIRNLIVNSVIPQNGKTGLGDIQIGILWDAINERTPWRKAPIFFSFGGGLRFPTGNFDLPMAFRQTGGDGALLLPGGTFDGIIRWNLDYEATPGVFLSWQNQLEYSFTKAIFNRSSMLYPGTFNTANPAAIQPGIPTGLNHGDGVGNVLVFSRRGVRFLGFLQANWGLGNVSRALKEIGFYAQAKYNIPAQNYLNGTPVYLFQDQFYLNNGLLHPNYGLQQAYSVVGGIKFSGLPDMFPLEFSAEYEYLFAGRNLFVAPMNFMMILAVYF